ncbi:MAG: alpha/beta fold hydrolase [Proteobacteria bacterium]|nr:alpha/beta fold hydrolase [Pseudomonadota bacterium]
MKLDKRIALRIAVAIAAAAYLGWHAFKPKAGAAPESLAAPIAANARAFDLGTLHFTACELAQKHSGATTSAFCSPFSVPENRVENQRSDANGRKIDLRMALIKSDATAADRDIVVFLAGGPGQSAIDTWPQIAPAFAHLLEHHHVLLLDQRGTGGSNALECMGGDDADDANGPTGFDADKVRARTQQCLADVGKHADPRFYTTTDAVADLEAVRQALGAPPFDLVGVSYGTRMAQQYAMRHPDGVRSIVLDSAVPNELVLGQDFAENLDNALKLQFAQCEQTPACKKAFGDPMASLYMLRDALRAHPQDYSYRDPVTFEGSRKRLTGASLVGLVRMFAYTPETAALLPLSIAEGLKGDYAPLAGQTKVLTGDMTDLSENAMQLSVVCSEDADLLASRAQDANTLLGNHLVDGIKAACEVWPHEPRPADFHAPLKTDIPVLILEGAFDPVTPPRYGEQILKGLGNARLLIAKGQGHNVIGRGCMPKLVGEFVDKLDPKTLDAKCVDRLGPMPAFLNFNGAAP